MIQYQYMCVCGAQLVTWVSRRDLKAGEQCERCSRVYDVAYDGTVTPMPLPATARVTLKGRYDHGRQYQITVDADRSTLKSSIKATPIR